jgi:hypothetical protein
MSICLRRREFIGAVGGATAWPLAAKAQPSAVPTIGILDALRPASRPSSENPTKTIDVSHTTPSIP